MYSYLTFKATRKPRIVKSGLTLEAAVTEASNFYDHARILSDHDLLASGVSILVLEDADADSSVKAGVLQDLEKIAYQCGGF